MKKLTHLPLLFLVSCVLSACNKTVVPASILAFNHTQDRHLHILMINGALGPNADPQASGGKSACCVSLPRVWHPGLTAKVQWTYDRLLETDPLLPPQSQDIEIPRYDHPGNVHIHLYDNHKIKIAISNCEPGHPFYPMDSEALLPWKANRTKEDYLKHENPNGPGDAC